MLAAAARNTHKHPHASLFWFCFLEGIVYTFRSCAAETELRVQTISTISSIQPLPKSAFAAAATAIIKPSTSAASPEGKRWRQMAAGGGGGGGDGGDGRGSGGGRGGGDGGARDRGSGGSEGAKKVGRLALFRRNSDSDLMQRRVDQQHLDLQNETKLLLHKAQ
eukprot:4809191-Pleurochrysis_carterae.AAC.1